MSQPEKFHSTIVEFINDLTTTFPEYKSQLDKWKDSENSESLYEYCVKVYPERFFDILYQNEEMFEDNEVNTCFLPEIDFKNIFSSNITENTKKSLWKYLQVILFSIVGSIKNKEGFGDTANLFEGINEADLEEKLKSTMDDIHNLFGNMTANMDLSGSETSQDASFSHPFENMPEMGNIHEHLKTLFDGKIGKLAKELAEEISGDLSNLTGDEEMKSSEDVLKNMMKNPKKMMNIIKMIGDKIKNKMDSGDISKDELMGEASELLNKMKEMGGTEQFNDIMKKFAGSMGKNAKFNKEALNKMMRQEAMKGRMKAKMDAKKNYTLEKNSNDNLVFNLSEEEKQERTKISDRAMAELLAECDKESEVKETKKVAKKKKKGKK
tara:strand:- start:2056 stop:3198 length:1143 start_codon:yes stop_codon:yes gene_type:complete